MKRVLAIFSIATIAAAVASAKEPARVAIAGNVDSAIAERACAWAATNLAIRVPYAGSMGVATGSLDEVAVSAAPSVGPDDVGLILLFGDGDENGNHGIHRPDLRVVVVNVAAMRKDADEETFARRIDRQVIRGVAALMGVEWSPDPFSATAMYSTMEELDRIGLNMDPPSLLQLQRTAVEWGIPVDPDNIWNMTK